MKIQTKKELNYSFRRKDVLRVEVVVPPREKGISNQFKINQGECLGKLSRGLRG